MVRGIGIIQAVLWVACVVGYVSMVTAQGCANTLAKNIEDSADLKFFASAVSETGKCSFSSLDEVLCTI